jgi:isocitrate dehydrogenase
MFEPAHGSAPKYTGMDKVNPYATILAGAWMLDYLDEKEQAKRIFKAAEKAIAEGYVTYDMGGDKKLSEVADRMIELLQK